MFRLVQENGSDIKSLSKQKRRTTIVLHILPSFLGVKSRKSERKNDLQIDDRKVSPALSTG